MNFEEKLKEKIQKLNIEIEDNQIDNFHKYMELLLEWNQKMNLTAITQEDDVILKHFVDSLTIQKYLKEGKSLADIGTGAGFPGIPLNIMNNDVKYTLVDSLNKRINFLNEVISNLDLKNIETMHSRIEEFGQNKKYRESFDIVTSRAVASLKVLLEYMLPLTKVGGICICMKASNIEEEINDSKKALEVLGGKIEKIEKIILPDSDIERNIIIIRKEKNTPKNYPRKPGTPSKEPIE